MSETTEVPKKLKTAILFNAANDLLLSLSLFFIPEIFIESSGWVGVDPFALRLIAAGLIAVAIESFLSRNSTLERVKGVLNIKVFTLGIGFTGVCISLFQSSHPPITAEWILFGGLLIPFIQLTYWKIHLEKRTN